MNRMIVPVLAALALAFAAYTFLVPQSSNQLGPLGAALAQEASEEIDTSTIVDMQMGNADAPVTVVEYASFTCPHCADFHNSAFKQLKADYIDTGKINFIYREVYFDPFGLWASAIARCAGPEKFFGIAGMVYAGQREWVSAPDQAGRIEGLRKIGRLAGIENDALEACLQDNDKLRTLVAWFQENAKADGIQSTPSFVINGKMYTNMPYADMAALIDEAAGS